MEKKLEDEKYVALISLDRRYEIGRVPQSGLFAEQLESVRRDHHADDEHRVQVHPGKIFKVARSFHEELCRARSPDFRGVLDGDARPVPFNHSYRFFLHHYGAPLQRREQSMPPAPQVPAVPFGFGHGRGRRDFAKGDRRCCGDFEESEDP